MARVVDWKAKKILNDIQDILDKASDKGADWVKDLAVQLVPKDEHNLERSIRIRKSKYKDGGYVVVADSKNRSGKPYASFVELGIPADPNYPRQAFMRPTVEALNRSVQDLYNQYLSRLLR